ncbi:MAG: hypothetical protein PWP51_844 [Clostridiales bacterium]|jgi:hypothetical protein|nr:hypothetical protein [Clostridiales bacterium]MDN5298291.1 hypothetical protein [Clostridiales bacterium]
MDRHRHSALGILVVLLGIVLIMDYYGIIHFDIGNLWPLILILVGYRAERDYFNGYAGARHLLLGTTLITYGIYFQLAELPLMPYQFEDKFWPIFIIGPGLGFLQMYYMGHRPKKNLRTGTLLVGLGSIFLIQEFMTLHIQLFLYVAVILFGIFLISKGQAQRDDMDIDAKHHEEKSSLDDDGERY